MKDKAVSTVTDCISKAFYDRGNKKLSFRRISVFRYEQKASAAGYFLVVGGDSGVLCIGILLSAHTRGQVRSFELASIVRKNYMNYFMFFTSCHSSREK